MKKIVLVAFFAGVFAVPVSLHAYTCDGKNNIPLCKPALVEAEYSEHFLLLEQIRKDYLYAYVRLLKARYLLRKEIPWVSRNILDAIELQSRMSHLRNTI